MCSLIRVNMCLFLLMFVQSTLYIHWGVEKICEHMCKWKWVHVYVCVWWGYHLFIISRIYTFNLKIMIRLNQTFFHLCYLTLRHPNWDRLAIFEILLSDKSRCRSLWLLVKPSMTLKKKLLLIYHLINNAGTRDLYTRSLQVHKQQSKWKHNILDNKNPSMQILPLNLTLNFFSGINLWPFILTQ